MIITKPVLIVLIIFGFETAAYNQCNSMVTSFNPGEVVTYQAYYNWGFIWIHAGDIKFSVDQKPYKNKKVYQFEAIGNTVPSYDWAYKVRDKYQSYVDMETFSPLLLIANTNEGGTSDCQTYVFSYTNKKIYVDSQTSKKPETKDSVYFSNCVYDVLSGIYYCRNINFSSYKINDKIPFSLIIENKIYPLYIRYLGKDIIKIHEDKQQFRCIKFSVLLVAGTIFKGGEDMTVYVTDDDNRIPVLVEAKILIGSVKAYLNTAVGLRSPETALIR